MTTSSDDDSLPMLLLPRVSVGTGNTLALSPHSNALNPAQAYLLSLNSLRSRQTMASFLGIVARILGAAGVETCNWGGLRRHHILAIIEMLRDAGRATATVNTYLSALKGVAKEAWMLRQMDVESYQHIRAIGNIRGSALARGRALTRAEIRQLFSICENDKSSKGVRDAAILGVLLGCGLRRSEAVALSISDLRSNDRAIKVLGKGNKERLAYLPEGSWIRLNRWIEEVRGEYEGPLFTRIRRHDDVTENRLTDQAIYHILQIRQRDAGMEKCAPHDLRRTFATAMLENGEDLITVKDAMGHASISTTQKYDRRGEQRLRDARDKINFD